MHGEADAAVYVLAAHILRQQKQIRVVDPNHVFCCLVHSLNWLKVGKVEVFVDLPQILLVCVVLAVKSLEVVEQGSQHELVELQELLHDVFFDKHWDTVEVCKDLSDLVLSSLVLNEDSRPSNPCRFHHRVSLLQVE